MQSKVKIKGEVFITIKKSNGEVVDEYIHNVVTNDGKEFFAKKIFESNSDARVSQIGIGTNDAAHVVTNTITSFNATSPIIKKDIIASPVSTIQVENGVANVITFISTFFDTTSDTLGGGTPVAIKEVALIGLSNDSPQEEVLLCRTTFDDSPNVGFTKTDQDIITITWKLTIS